jgi:hypothetical protein
MNGKQWGIFWGMVSAAGILAGLGFAAMSINPPFTIPEWLPTVFFTSAGCAFLLSIGYLIYNIINQSKKTALQKKYEANPQGKDTYEEIKQDVIRNIQSGKIKVKGIISDRIENLSSKDISFVIMLSKEMEFRYSHGHSDSTGLLADRASGIALNELIKRECTICGKPRNQRGEK